MSISNQTAHQIDNTLMARMLDFGNIFELINDRLNNCTFADQNAVDQFHRQAIFRISFQFSNQLNADCLAEQIKQGLRNMAFVATILPNSLRTRPETDLQSLITRYNLKPPKPASGSPSVFS